MSAMDAAGRYDPEEVRGPATAARETASGCMVSAVDQITTQAGSLRDMVIDLRLRLLGRSPNPVPHPGNPSADESVGTLHVTGTPVEVGLLEDITRQARVTHESLAETGRLLGDILEEL